MWGTLIKRSIQRTSMPFYAVRSGRAPGIYSNWDDCKSQVDRYPKARYKKFSTQQEAEDFVNGSDGYYNQPSYHTPTYNCTADNDYNTYTTSYHQPSSSNTSYSAGQRTLKQQADHLASVAHQLSEQINAYEQKSHKRLNGGQQNAGSKRSYTTTTSYGSGQSYQKRFKSDDSRGSSFETSDSATVYTDGACYGNGQNGATAGIGVYWGNNHPDNVSERLPGRQTNNRAEIHAAVHAIRQAKSKGIKNLTLKTDSQFCINGITSWIHNWKRNGWKLSSGQPVVNKADFQELESELAGINVKWEHVRGHKGEPGNEAADRLANRGAEKPPVKR